MPCTRASPRSTKWCARRCWKTKGNAMRRGTTGAAASTSVCNPQLRRFAESYASEGAMPTYKYEAMDTSGGEVKDSVEATERRGSPAENPPDGLLRHQDHRSGRAPPRTARRAKAKAKQKGQNLHHRRRVEQAAVYVHAPVLDAARRRSAGAALAAHSRTSDEARRPQERPHRRGRRRRVRQHA